MKNKLKKTMTALCAALILMGGFSVPAYAQGAATEPPAGDATNDSNVVVEEKEETPPLTPKGNATLVDDYGGNKQLITVTTKGGNYFYILIDRAAEGEQTVHFLNQVDEADLMALTENGEAAKKPEICNCTEKCEAGKVNTSCPVCVTSMTGCTGKEPTPTPTEQPEELKEKGGNPGVVLALVLFALLGGAPIPDLPDRKTICIMERGNEKCQPKNESTQRRRVTMRPSRRGQCGWSPSRGGPAGRWPRNSASASTRCAAG